MNCNSMLVFFYLILKGFEEQKYAILFAIYNAIEGEYFIKTKNLK